ncbi:hypothetical protein HUU53_00675 [Candidatus Micrarchaeota archaeon]|nr:hypothetical protein [Candidatus Micrarchaeota archaeon]
MSLSISQLLGVLLLLASSFATIYYGLDRKKHPVKTIFSITGFVLGLLLFIELLNPLFAIQPTQTIPTGANVLYSNVQEYTQKTEPLVCDQGELIYWRQLRTYELDTPEGRKTFTTITLNVKNVGSTPVKDILVKEKLPAEVATLPEELIDFNIQPLRFEEGSVVVTWLMDNVDPGETESRSYTVEKELDNKVLDDYDAPKVISRQLDSGPATTSESTEGTTQGGIDFTLIGLAGVIVILGGAAAFLMKRQ